MTRRYFAVASAALTFMLGQNALAGDYVVPINCSSSGDIHTNIVALNSSDKSVRARVQTTTSTTGPTIGTLTVLPGDVVELDCAVLRKEHQGLPGSDFKGFTIIQSGTPLKVSAHYKSGAGSSTSIDVQRITSETTSTPFGPGQVEQPRNLGQNDHFTVRKLQNWKSCENGIDFPATSVRAAARAEPVVLQDENRTRIDNPASGYVGSSVSPNIVYGGKVDSMRQYPFMAHLRVKLKTADGGLLQSYCGATILNENWVLTAAHCVNVADFVRNFSQPLDLEEVSIGVGHLDERRARRVKSTKALCHKEYNGVTLAKDIALLRLEKPLVMQPGKVQPAKLPEQSASNEITPGVWAAGWGTADDDKLSPVLLHAKLAKETVFDKLFTVFGQNRRGSVCFGDSGGGIFADTATRDVIGISSYVSRPPEALQNEKKSCRYHNVQSGFTRVSAYVDAINEALSTCTDNSSGCFKN